jgi:hypothetical protein
MTVLLGNRNLHFYKAVFMQVEVKKNLRNLFEKVLADVA